MPSRPRSIAPLHYPAVVLSDAHLGMPGVRAALLLEFLQNVECETLIINGDLIDGLRLARRNDWALPETSLRILDAINRKIEQGTKVFYIPGNHDDHLRNGNILGQTIDGIAFAEELTFDDGHGRRLLVLHGDRFKPAWESGDAVMHIHDTISRANAALEHAVHKILGVHFSAAAQGQKIRNFFTHVGDKMRVDALAYMHEKNADGVICGHIHMPSQKGSYANAGDWVQNSSALAMDEAGRWRLLDWSKMRRERGLKNLPDAGAPNPDARFRPASERLLALIRAQWQNPAPIPAR